MPDADITDNTPAGTDTAGMDPARITPLNSQPAKKGACLIYWMQQAQRAHWNHALEFAAFRANQHRLPLLAVFCLTDNFPEANLRHYTFMAEGLCETGQALEKRGIRFILRAGDPEKIILSLARDAAEIICDTGYTRIQRQWRNNVAKQAPCPVIRVETDVVVPVETASEKAEYAARTLRPKIQKLMDRFIQPVTEIPLNHPATSLSRSIPSLTISSLNMDTLDFSAPPALLSGLSVDASVQPVPAFFKGGTSEAIRRFDDFLEKRMARYTQNSNQPQTDDISHMSPYLHFGQISPVYLAWRVTTHQKIDPEIAAAFLEELIVRRELAVNFVWFTHDYDAFSCLPQWAQKTLADHAKDRRDHRYRLSALDGAKTHDPYWNAAMDEMKHTGFMHNYMRMYWGKKILEWSDDPEIAFKNALLLNNKYFLDGRDPNSFAGVAWIFGQHDRAWKERAIFGKVRYMNAAGLERKCDIKGYVKKIDRIKQTSG